MFISIILPTNTTKTEKLIFKPTAMGGWKNETRNYEIRTEPPTFPWYNHNNYDTLRNTSWVMVTRQTLKMQLKLFLGLMSHITGKRNCEDGEMITRSTLCLFVGCDAGTLKCSISKHIHSRDMPRAYLLFQLEKNFPCWLTCAHQTDCTLKGNKKLIFPPKSNINQHI